MSVFPLPLVLALTAGLLVAASLSVGPDGRLMSSGDPEPTPDLAPEEVVRIQVEALQHNDAPVPDAGIATAFRFASPGNRAATGPLSRFTQMIKLGYADMLNFDEAVYGPIQVVGENARQAVTLVQPGGRRTTYLFGLSRQVGGDCAGCWMTDGVMEQTETDRGIRRT